MVLMMLTSKTYFSQLLLSIFSKFQNIVVKNKVAIQQGFYKQGIKYNLQNTISCLLLLTVLPPGNVLKPQNKYLFQAKIIAIFH